MRLSANFLAIPVCLVYSYYDLARSSFVLCLGFAVFKTLDCDGRAG